MTDQPSVKFVARVSAFQQSEFFGNQKEIGLSFQRREGDPAFLGGGGCIATTLVFIIHESYMQLNKHRTWYEIHIW